MGHRRFVATIHALVLGLSCAMLQATAAVAPRNAYERLDLATPEAAVAQFVQAWRGRDYVSAFWILAPTTQQILVRDVAAFHLGAMLGPLPADRAEAIVVAAVPPIDSWEQWDTSWVFDRLMMAADAEKVSPLRLPDQGTTGPVRTDDSGQATVAFGTGPDAVMFRLVRLPSGQWRVLSATGPGSDPGQPPPWGIGERR